MENGARTPLPSAIMGRHFRSHSPKINKDVLISPAMVAPLGDFDDTPEFPTLISEDGRKILTHISWGMMTSMHHCSCYWCHCACKFYSDNCLDLGLNPRLRQSMQWGSIIMLVPCGFDMLLLTLHSCYNEYFKVSDLDSRPEYIIPGTRLLKLSANFNRIVTDMEYWDNLDESEDPHPASPQPLISSDDQIALADILVHPSQPDGEVISSMDRRTTITVRNVDNRREIVLPIDFDIFKDLFTLD